MFYTVKKIFLLDILEAIPDEDWRIRKTIMLRMTSKNAKQIIDKMRLHVNVCLKFHLRNKSWNFSRVLANTQYKSLSCKYI